MLFRNFGIPELIIVLVLAILIFGPGRLARIGSELGKGIRGFKSEVKDAAETSTDASADDTTA